MSSSEDPFKVVGQASPRPVSEAGTLIPRERFRSWLESRTGPLDKFLAPLAKGAALAGDFNGLIDAVVLACRGAYTFSSVDWRRPLRNEDTRLKVDLPVLIALATDLTGRLSTYDVRLTILTGWLANAAKVRYGEELRFPFPAEGTLIEFLTLLTTALVELEKRLSVDALPHMSQHGCLDYGRHVHGDKVTDLRRMLAFNLVFLFRSATAGPWRSEGRMPVGRDARPHFGLVANLVNATLGEGQETPMSDGWVHSTVKAIINDNPEVSVVAWPIGRDQIGIDTWYMPAQLLE